MVFRKKKPRMIDVRELQRRGVVRIPEKEVVIPTDSSGFVELGNNSALENEKKNSSNENFFGYNSKLKKTVEATNFSSESEGYNKREVDAKIIELDNKIYKLEQRMELLERKAGVNQPGAPGSLIGW